MYQGTMIIQQAKNRTVYDRLESLGSQAYPFPQSRKNDF